MRAAGERICSVSVDLDALSHYHAIHGLAAPGDRGADPVYTVALPRFLDLFDELGLRATFFAVGADLEHPAAADALARAHRAGHEVANHTYTHSYDLGRLRDAEVAREITRGHDAIELATGAACVGFRAPGYNVDARMLDVCRALGYTYDSSVFPSPPYYFAKAAVMAAMRIRGSPSRAWLGDARVLAAPTTPYVPDERDYTRRAPPGVRATLVELPITLVPGLRFPFIGTWICLWGDSLFDAAFALVRASARFVNLELHGVELLGLEEDALPSVLRRQPDLRVPLSRKRRRLLRAISAIAGAFSPMRLCDAAASFAADA